MERVRKEAKAEGDAAMQASSAARRARWRPRASRVAGGLAITILLVMLGAYVFSMYAGGMEHSISSETTLHQDAVTTSVAAPVTGDQMVMADGEVMDMDEHPSESPGTAVTEADQDAPAAVGASHSEEMGGSVNWYVIGGILALVAAGIAVVAGVMERLARGIATGANATEGVSDE